MAGLQVTSPRSCASASAARAAASLPHGASTKALRKASPPASRANAPLSRARSIQAVVSRSTAASSSRSAAVMAASSRRRRATSGSTSSARKASTARRIAGTRGGVPARDPCRVAPEQQVGGRVRWVSRSVAGSARSVRSRPAERRSRPIRRRLRTPGPRAGRPSRRGDRAAAVVRPHRPARRRPRPHVPAGGVDPAAQPSGLRGRQRIPQAPRGLAQQGVGSIDGPREHVGLGCGELPLGSRLLVGRQLRRALQQRRRRGVAAAAPGPLRCRLQLGRDSFVGPGGGRGEVPGAGNRVELGIAGVRQRAVGLALLVRRGRVVDRRPDERVEEPHLRPEDHQPGGLRRRGGGLGDAQRGGRLPQEVVPGPGSPPPRAAAASACRAGSSRTRRRKDRSSR